MTESAGELLQRGHQARREHHRGAALASFTAAIALCRRTGDDGSLVEALKGLAQIERDLGRSAAAQPRYEEAVEICRRRGDPLPLAHTLRHLGDAYAESGRSAEAGRAFDEALAIYRRQGDASPLDLANALRSVALHREQMEEEAEAAALWREAMGLYEETGIEDGVEECRRRLARLAPPSSPISATEP